MTSINSVSKLSESNYLTALDTLTNYENAGSEARVIEFLQNHSSDLISDLATNPKSNELYQRNVTNFKDRKTPCIDRLDYLQRIAKCLEKFDTESIQKLSLQMSHLIPDLKIFNKFSELSLIKDFNEIKEISHPVIRTFVIANLINRDKIALKELALTKEEILKIGPFLTFVDSRRIFDEDWKLKETSSFLDSCSENVKILKIDARVRQLPLTLPECEELDCCHCDKLEKLPSLPKCKILQCSYCEKLTSIPELLTCESLDCSFNPRLTKLPKLPKCKTLNCNDCKIGIIGDLPNCETLDCCNNVIASIGSLPKCKILNCSHNPVLSKITSLPCCEYLSCQECTILKVLPFLPSCHYLYCNGCISLCGLSYLSACKELYCNRCTNLQDVGMLPNCEKISCSGSSRLKALPSLPKCKDLDCSSSGNLVIITALPVCETLNCNNCRELKTLPSLPNCQRLEICHCKQLEELPHLPNCRILNCTDCYGLNSLADLPLCEEIDCSNNILTQISSLPNCRTFKCRDSLRLKEIPALPKCQILDCSDSINLTKIFDLPACRDFFCGGCVCLEFLPELPFCETLHCNECLKLTELPDLFMCDHLNIEGSDNLEWNIPPRFLSWEDIEDTLQISVKELRKNPLKVLFRLRDYVFENRFLPAIEFIEKDGRVTEGIDAGGISRIFISRLMKSLILNSHKDDQLAFKEMESGLYMPYLDPTRNLRRQILGFRILGSLFDLCLWSKGLKLELRTGILFDPELFAQILNFSYKQLENIDFYTEKLSLDSKLHALANSTDLYLSKMGQLLLKPVNELTNEFEFLKDIIINQIDEEEKVPENFYPKNFLKKDPSIQEINEMLPWISQYIKKMLTQDVDGKIIPAVIIAKELRNRIGAETDFENLRKHGFKKLEDKIQGVLSSEIVLKAIKYLDRESHINEESMETTKNYVERWIGEASKNDLENFVSFISGSPTISESTELRIDFYNFDDKHLPSSHTCSHTLDLTVKYPDFETFKIRLEKALEYAGNLKTSGIEVA